MQYWIKNSSTAQSPYTHDELEVAPRPTMVDGELSAFQAPSERRGDRMFWHAIGSAAWLGDGRFFALGEVTSDKPFLTDHEQWPWALKVTILAEVPLLSQAPRLGDVGIRRDRYVGSPTSR